MNQDERWVKQLSPKGEDFSKWYLELIRKAELADYAPMKGMMVIRPYGFAVWENIQRLLDKRIKDTGHVNAYFPLFIPDSLFRREMEHLKGFAPEVAWVTHGGSDELEERLAVRPTSEAIIGHMYSKWIKSYRDLPVLINQWANIVRWEKVTRPFLRTTEFLWQEGHTAHATPEEAQQETLMILTSVYKEFVETDLAIPVIAGKKTEREKFAGALETYAIEGLMGDGKALQMGTSHNLGQHFAKVFDIRFEDRNQNLQYAWQTSWGVSTRLIGALVMSHGDESGLFFPPSVAPVQVVVVPIALGNWKENVLPKAKEIAAELAGAGIRVKLDDREEFTPGWKFSEYEMRGVPLRVEIGPRDVKENKVVLVRRDGAGKESLPVGEVRGRIPQVLSDIQKSLYARALKFQADHTHQVENYDEFKNVMEIERGFIKAFWCGDQSCEDKIKDDTMSTIRILPLDQEFDKADAKCVCCRREGRVLAYFARAY